MQSGSIREIIMMVISGLILGSFGSVILWRSDYPRSRDSIKSLLIGRSACPGCGSVLHWYDLIPLVSWLIHAGKCRVCKQAISTMYPVLELVSAAMMICGRIIGGLVSDSELIKRGFAIQCRLLGLLAVWDWYRGYLHVTVWLMSILTRIVMLTDSSIWQALQRRDNAIYAFGGFVILYIVAGRYAGKKITGRWGAWREGLGEGDLWLMVSLLPLMIMTPARHPLEYLGWYWLLAGGTTLIFLVITIIQTKRYQQTIAFFPGLIVAAIGMLMRGLW